MAKVQGTFYTAERLRRGTSPVSPAVSVDEEGNVEPVQPASPVDHNSTLNKQGGDPANNFFGHVTEAQLNGLIGLLSPPAIARITQTGTISFPTSTTLSADDWKAIFPPASELDTTPLTLDPITDSPSNYNRIDSVYYKDDGTIGYVTGVEDPEGAQFPPAIPAGTLRMADILRTPTGDNTVYLTPEDAEDFVSKSETSLQTIQSLLAFAQLARTSGISRVPILSVGGVLSINGSPAQNDVYTTTFGGGGTWSKLVTINLSIPSQINYFVMLEFAGISTNYEKGQLWIQFRVNDTTGDLEDNLLKCFGDMVPAKYKLVRLDASTYAVFANHDESDSNYKFRPIFQYGNSSITEYHHQEPRTTLPVGDQYDFVNFLDQGNAESGTWRFDTGTTDSDPGTGKMRANNATIADATWLYFSNTTYGGVDGSRYLALLKSGDTIYTQLQANAEHYARWKITGDAVANSGYVAIPVEYIDGGGTAPTDNKLIYVDFNQGSGVSVNGIPSGGTTGQVFKKQSNIDYDADWEDERPANIDGGFAGSVYLTVQKIDGGTA